MSTEPSSQFTAAEELACYFDSDCEPCNIHVELRVPGRLDKRAFQAAAVAALMADPRASSRRADHGTLSRSYHWERPGSLDVDPVSVVPYADSAQLSAIRDSFMATAPAVDAAPPLRLLVATGPDGDHVILNVHHAAMDGLSCVELLRSIAQRYQATPGLAAGQPALARSRPVAGQPVPTGTPGTQAAGSGPAGARRRPARIAGEHGGGRGCGLHLELLSHVPAVRPFGDGTKATLNEALIAALIMTVGRWNCEHGRAVGAVRITTPVNTRLPGEPFAVGNRSRLVTVSAAPPAAGAGPGPLLRAVVMQARHARTAGGPQLGAASRRLAAGWCPTGVKRQIVRAMLHTVAPLVVDTVMLSNLGNVPDPPDFGVPGPVTMAFSAPAHMPRGLCVGVITASGRLQIAVRYNRALMNGAAAVRFGAMLRSALLEITVSHHGNSETPAASTLTSPL